jgi:putative phosphoribosyl transferase
MRRSSVRFADRKDAGLALARSLVAQKYVDPVVLCLPRGGVPVAIEVARALRAPLDLVLVRKIGVPNQREVAAAAVVDGGAPEVFVNEDVLATAGITRSYVEKQAIIELDEIARRRHVYLEGRAHVPVEGRVLIVVDDGIATGASIRAAVAALRRKRPSKLVLAVPVASRSALEDLRSEVDEIVCLSCPEPFHAVGMYYDDFAQVDDNEVVRLMREANRSASTERSSGELP